MADPLELAKVVTKLLKACGIEAVVLTRPVSIEVCQGRWSLRYRVEGDERPVRVAARVFTLMQSIRTFKPRKAA